jgi:diaminopimelate epimerase
MRIPFTKMHGLWNDFVVLDRINYPDIRISEDVAKSLWDRHFWVGCDQILIIEKSEKVDFRYRIYNQDGSEVREKWLTEKNEVRVETAKGMIILRTDGKNIAVDMGAPILDDEKIPVKKWIREVSVEGRKFSFTPVSMWNPHAVIFLDEAVSNFSVQKYGRPIEICTDIFPRKVNVEFVNILSASHIEMRVWERGTGETLACGTGACAAVVAGILSWKLEKNMSIKVSLRWWDLYISWSWKEKESVMMSGPAVTVFDGEFIMK